MDRKHGFGWFALALLAGLWFPAVATAAPAAEQRCTELGASCICSEPMNWLQSSGAAYGGGKDPTDSEGTGAKECGGNGRTADWDTDVNTWQSVPVPNRPASASTTWQYVQQVNHPNNNDGNQINWWWGAPVSTSNGTICTRSYHNIGTLPWMTSGNHRIKVAQWFGNTTTLTQLEWAHDQSRQATGYLRAQAGPQGGYHGNVVSFQDCREAWCRIEYCLDYNGSNTTFRVRISKVGTPSKTEVIGPVTQSNSRTPPLTFATAADVAIGDLFVQCLGATPCPFGTRSVAFGIETLVQPMNTAFWPGAAYEVESGSGGTPPPPPPPPPPTGELGKPGTPIYQP